MSRTADPDRLIRELKLHVCSISDCPESADGWAIDENEKDETILVAFCEKHRELARKRFPGWAIYRDIDRPLAIYMERTSARMNFVQKFMFKYFNIQSNKKQILNGEKDVE